MMEFRRWLKQSRTCVVTGTFLLAGVAGCQTDSGAVRSYTPESPATTPAPLVVPEADRTVADSTEPFADAPQPNLSPEPVNPVVVPPTEPVSRNQTTSTGDSDSPGDSDDEPARTESDNTVAAKTSRTVTPDATFEESTNDTAGTPSVPTASVKPESVQRTDETVDAGDVFEAPVDSTEAATVTAPTVSSIQGTPRALDRIVLEAARTSNTPVETSVVPVPQIDLPEPAEAAAVAESPSERDIETSTDTETADPVKAVTTPVITDGPAVEERGTTGDVITEKETTGNGLEATPTVSTPTVEEDQFAAIEKPEVVTSELPGNEPVVGTNTRLISDQRLPVFHVTADAQGNAYLSQRDAILLVQPDGQSRIWARLRAPRGHIILPDGSHVVCLAGQRAVVRLNADGEMVEEIASRSEDSFLRSPSHVVDDGHGGLYFTDPGYARIRNPIGSLHYISPEGETQTLARNLASPEGLALSSDGSRLLVAESQRNRVIEFPVLAPGKLGTSRVLARLPKKTSDAPDGFAHSLALDKLGRVYVAHGGTQHVEVIDRDGTVSQRHHVPNVITTGVAFVPGDPQRLFVAGSDRQTRRGRLLEVTLD